MRNNPMRRKLDNLHPVLDLKPEQILPKSHIWVYRSLSFGMAIILGVILLLTYWLNFPFKTLEVYNSPLPAHKDNVQRNEYLSFTSDYCKFTKAEGTVQRFIVTKNKEIMLPEQIDNTGPICQKTDFLVLIPAEEALVGQVYVRYEITYQVNPLRTVTVKFDTSTFNVEEK